MPLPRFVIPLTVIRVIAAVRVRIARHPAIYWSTVAAVAALVGLAVHGELASVDRARAGWGTARDVLVAISPIAPGVPIDSHNVAHRTLPIAAFSPDALDALPPDAIALHPITPGEVVLSTHVAPGIGASARLPAGTSGVSIPADRAVLELSVGDSVDVVVVADPLDAAAVGTDAAGTAAQGPGTVLASGSVIAVAEASVVIAVPSDAAATTAALAASGRAVLVLRRAPVCAAACGDETGR